MNYVYFGDPPDPPEDDEWLDSRTDDPDPPADEPDEYGWRRGQDAYERWLFR